MNNISNQSIMSGQVKFSSKNGIPFLPTKIVVYDGRKIPCFLKSKGAPNEFNKNPFYKWTLQEIENHKKWLEDTGKIKECNAIINLLSQTNFIMIDTDSEETTQQVEQMGFSDTFTTNSMRGKGKHYYIKSEKEGKEWKKEIKINGEDLDFITDYAFESLEKTAENVKQLITLHKEELEEKFKFKILLKGYKKIKTTPEERKMSNNDTIRNDFLNKNDYITKELLFRIIKEYDPNYFKGYDKWIQLVVGMSNQVRKPEEYDEYFALLLDFISKIDTFKPVYIQENLQLWGQLKTNTYQGATVKSGTFWYWLREMNPQRFIELKTARNGKLNYGIFNELKKYQLQKRYFEEYICSTRGAKLTYKEFDKLHQVWTDMNEDGLKSSFKCLQTWIKTKDKKGNEMDVPVSFIDKWLMDVDRRVYEGCDFLPPPLKCPETWFNLYDGMAVDDIEIKLPENEETIKEIISPILTHIYNLSGRDQKNYEFLLNILSYNFNYPGKRTRVAVIFRSKQGTGKNLFLEWNGQKLKGDKYYSQSSDHDVFLSRFANGFDGKLDAVFDEMEMGHKVEKRLKELTTANKISTEKKGIMTEFRQIVAQLWYLTNKDNAVRIDEWNRRNEVMDCYEGVRGDDKYFDNLVDAMDDILVGKCYVHFLRNIINTPEDFNFERNRPCGKAFKDMVDKNSPPMINFLQSIRYDEDLNACYTLKSFYDKYSKFLTEYNYNYKLDFRQFKQLLKAYSVEESDGNNSHRIINKFKLYEKAPISYKIDKDKYEILMEEYEEECDRDVKVLSEQEQEGLFKYEIEEDDDDTED